MTIRSDRNLYPGVNAHFNSFLQQRGWESFHARLIGDLQEAINVAVPSNYYAVAEMSLQISKMPLADDPFGRSRVRPDISIFQETPQARTPSSYPATATPPVATFPLDVLVDDEPETVMAVLVYAVDTDDLPGLLVTRVEVLSPANKPPGSDYRNYLRKRTQTLRAGTQLVEIDLLHEQRAVIADIPNYATGEATAYPYNITISFPHQIGKPGATDLYGAGVLEPLPSIPIPLKGQDVVIIDMNSVYQTAYQRVRFGSFVVDYAADPPNFDRYRPDDQARIRGLLDGIRAEQGQN
jgi:hypothetical protein